MNEVHPSTLDGLLPNEAALERLVYLVGPARGGTTLLHNAMNLDPHALVLPKVTHFMQNVWRYHGTVHERLLRQIMRMGPSWDQQSIEARLDREQRAEFARIVNAAFAQRDPAALYRILPIAFSLSPSFRKRASDVVCWQDKSNDWRYFGMLARAFPKSRFIFLMRDPRSVVLSSAARMAVKAGETSASLKPANIVTMSLYWRMMAQRCLDFSQRHPDRSRIVRYEDFLAEPAATLSELFRFTSGDAPSIAEIEGGVARLGGGSTLDPGETYSGVSRAPGARWKSAMTTEQIDLVASITAPTARKLGYDLSRCGAVDPIRSVFATGGASGAVRLILEEAYELVLRPPSEKATVVSSGSKKWSGA